VKQLLPQSSSPPAIEILDAAPAGDEIVARLRVAGLSIGLRMRRNGRAPALVVLTDDVLRDRIVAAVRVRIGSAV